MGNMDKVTKLSITALVIALIVSASLISYDYFFVSPQAQTDMNIRRTNALKGWLLLMDQVDSTLKNATSNYDVKQAWLYVAYARPFAPILCIGSSEKLYSSICTATSHLSDGLMGMGFGGSVENLSQTGLSFISNLTDNLDGLLVRSASTQNQTYSYLWDWLPFVDSDVKMDPAQQLREVGINMTNVIGYVNQIEQLSHQIIETYGYP
jgi:hypothetical protein